MPKRKHMRLPNGFGRITELKGRKLRNPFRVMITVGKDEYGKPIGRLLKPKAYFQTYNEAYKALMEYNENPFDLCESLTCNKLFEKWLESYGKDLAPKTVNRHQLAWRFCWAMYDVEIRSIRAKHIQLCIDEGYYISERGLDKGQKHYPSANMKKAIKNLWNMLFDYAVNREYTDRNYARDVKMDKNIQREIDSTKKDHIAFTDEELSVLWNHLDVPYVDMILIQCYSGWRPNELLDLKTTNLDLINWNMTGGSKTKAGINRCVPIHSSIRQLVSNKYDSTRDRLFDATYSVYYDRFKEIVKRLGLNPEHSPHDPRKTFVTLAKKYGVNEYAIKRIVGHQIKDVTEQIYTERSLEWLSSEIEKIRAHVTDTTQAQCTNSV